ncbi:iron hydrogenase small subunit [Dehalobacter sp. TBBPA1]|uniref:iron hydrogenase small subunit n=1 Tax=Dehalobacter sp. TBBPA1 TaxID=3235037 RepID=UPI0034A104AB
MAIFYEKDGINRRQFLKGAGAVIIAAAFPGIFTKIGLGRTHKSTEYIAQRAAGLYSLDEKMTIRKSHENSEVLQLYKDFLSPGEVKPLSSTSHHLLHTKYGKEVTAYIEELKDESAGKEKVAS